MTFAQFNKNLFKSLFLSVSIVMLSLATYGFSSFMMLVNFTYSFVLSLMATNSVDIIYWMIERRRELKKNG
jgi:hypothetical protein